MAPFLFNIYTNDQSSSSNTSHILYADDLALTCLATTFEENGLFVGCSWTHLSPIRAKTQSCVFFLRIKEAGRKLNIVWGGVSIEHSNFLKYLGVTLNRSLSYSKTCDSIKQKVHTCNSLLRRLVCSNRGASPHVLRATALAISFSSDEFACPVLSRLAYETRVCSSA